ncbi:monocarboxylate transporter 12-like [Lineus longissimus]|uniref:monocarboxylate transporter 12-like n=1 Tax=Lineus longissimus TaxID=88925 RepID=UPI00315D51B1
MTLGDNKDEFHCSDTAKMAPIAPKQDTELQTLEISAEKLALEQEKELIERGVEDAAESASPFPEGGYGWVIVCASFIGHFMFPLCLSFGLFHVALQEQFGRSKGVTALVGSMTYGFAAGLGPVGGLLCSLIGHRWTCILGCLLTCSGFLLSAFTKNFVVLFFSYGILIGTGICFVLLPSTVMNQFYFQKRRSLVTGIVRSGSGLGSIVLPLFIQYLIDSYSWRGAMILLAGISLQGCVSGAAYRPNAQIERKIANESEQNKSLKEGFAASFDVFKDFRFLLSMSVTFLEGVHSVVFFVLLPDRVVGYGFSADQAAFLLFLTGIGSISGRLLGGVVLNVLKWNTILPFGFALAMMGGSHLILVLYQPLYGILIFAAVWFGFWYGVFCTIIPLYMVQVFGLQRVTFVYGWVLFSEGLGGFIGPPIGGALYDMTGIYSYSFLVTASITLIGGLLNIPIYILDRIRKKKEDGDYVL